MGEGLFPSAARFNHACAPNVGLSFDSWGCLVASAARDAAQGEELFISYVGAVAVSECAVVAEGSSIAAGEKRSDADTVTVGLGDSGRAAALPCSRQGPRARRCDDGQPRGGGSRGGVMEEGNGRGSSGGRGGGEGSNARAERRGRLLRTYLFECDCKLCARGG